MHLSKKTKFIILLVIIITILLIVQIYISNLIQSYQNELDDLNQEDSNYNFQASLLSTIKSAVDNSTEFANIKNLINPTDKLTIDESADISKLIKYNQSNIFWLNIVNTLIITIEMFIVGLFTSMVLISDDNPLFEIEKTEINGKEITIIKALPTKYKLHDTVQNITKLNKSVKAFRSQRPSLKDMILKQFTSNKGTVYADNTHIDTPREPPNSAKSTIDNMPSIWENAED